MMLVIRLAGGCFLRVRKKITSNKAMPKKIPPTTNRIFVLVSTLLAVARVSLAGAVAVALADGVVTAGAVTGAGVAADVGAGSGAI